MRSKFCFNVLSWLAPCIAISLSLGCASAAEVADYGRLVSEYELPNAHAADLRRCIRNWEEMHAQRVDSPDNATQNTGGVLLEIGSSGFPSYDYVRVDGTMMKSSFGPERDVAATELGRRLVRLYAGAEETPESQARNEMDDGECYFLTVYVRGKPSSTVVYGAMTSLRADSLIRELAESAVLP